jgi:hypothetical protein
MNYLLKNLEVVLMKDSAKITVIFPEKSDTNAEREFIQRLKAIYLERVVASALQCPPLVNTKGKYEKEDI